jgi:hypothetical protein
MGVAAYDEQDAPEQQPIRGCPPYQRPGCFQAAGLL